MVEAPSTSRTPLPIFLAGARIPSTVGSEAFLKEGEEGGGRWWQKAFMHAREHGTFCVTATDRDRKYCLQRRIYSK